MTAPVANNGLYAGADLLETLADAVNYNRFLLAMVAARARAGDAILDFGAGAGTFALPLAESGLRVACVEPDAALRRRLASAGLVTHADAGEVAPRSIDYVYTLNVLEHIADDGAAAERLYDMLKPGGRLLVYVPAFQILYSAMDARIGHHRRYRRRSLTALLAAAGFTVESARYVDSLGFAAALVYRLIGDREGGLDARAVKLYDRLVFPPSRVLDQLLSRVLGKNLLVHAYRP